MANTSTPNTSTKTTQANKSCCGGHDDHAKKHKLEPINARFEADAMPDDQTNVVELDKSGCCCGGKKHA